MLLRDAQGSWPVAVDWYGGARADRLPLEEGRALIAAHRLEKAIALHPPTLDARAAYWSAAVAMLASLYEGLPNTICEAMACGKPVLASNVSDNPRLVCPGECGFLFDPADPASIASTISRFCSLRPEQRAAMGASARQKAEVLFSPRRFLESYLELLIGPRGNRRQPTGL